MNPAPPRIAILGIHLEANAFAPITTGADFRDSCYFEGDAMLAEAAKSAPAMPAEIPGFIAAMNATEDTDPDGALYALARGAVGPDRPVSAPGYKWCSMRSMPMPMAARFRLIWRFWAYPMPTLWAGVGFVRAGRCG